MSSSANEMFDTISRQQAQFLLVEETRLARAQRDQAGQPPVDPQRQQCERIVAFAGERCTVGGARVAGDIVRDHRFAGAQRAREKAVGVRRVAVVGFDHAAEQRGVRLGGCREPGPAVPVDLDDARQHEAAAGERNAADFVEQQIALADAHDRGVQRAEQLADPAQALDARALLDLLGDIARHPVDAILAARAAHQVRAAVHPAHRAAGRRMR